MILAVQAGEGPIDRGSFPIGEKVCVDHPHAGKNIRMLFQNIVSVSRCDRDVEAGRLDSTLDLYDVTDLLCLSYVPAEQCFAANDGNLGVAFKDLGNQAVD